MATYDLPAVHLNPTKKQIKKKKLKKIEGTRSYRERERRNNRRSRDSKKERDKKKSESREVNLPPVHLNPEEKVNNKKDDRGTGEKILDTISAPLSKPGVTFKEGLAAGSRAVAESREQIENGDVSEAFGVVGTTVASTAVVAGAVLAGEAIAGAVGRGVAGAATRRAIASGNAQQAAIFGRIAPKVTTKTTGTIGKTLTKVLSGTTMKVSGSGAAKISKVLAGVSGVLGTYIFAEWAGLEGIETIPFVLEDAIRSGDPELIAEARDVLETLENPNIWQKIGRLFPGTNILVGFGKKGKAIRTNVMVQKKIAENELTAIQTGESDDQKWERIRQQEVEAERKNIDYYNEQRRKMVEWENEARMKQLEKEAEFWRKEREKQAKQELEDAKAIAEFWLEYKRQSQKLYESTRPSNLNFGLL